MEMKSPFWPTQLKWSNSNSSRVTLTLDKAIEHELEHGRRLDPNMDRRKLRRTISNRLSAQRSRIRKTQYINDMEKMVKDFEELISVLTPRIKSYEEKRMLLLLQNDSLQKLIELRTNESKLSEIELEEKRAEVCRLRELEKTANENSDDPQHVQDLISRSKSYPSRGRYQNALQRLHKFEVSEFCQQQLIVTNSSLVDQQALKMEPKTDYTFRRPMETSTSATNQEEAEVDQYFNFEELNIDQTSGSE